MSCSKFHRSAIAVLTGLALSAQAASIYDAEKKTPSIYDGQADKEAAANKNLASDVLAILKMIDTAEKAKNSQKLIGPDGKKTDLSIRYNWPSGRKDADGNEMSRLKALESDMIARMTYEILTSNGYSWEEQEKRIKEIQKRRGASKVPEDWAEEQKRIREYIEKNGPIRSDFGPIIKGLTAKESTEVRKRAYAYTWIDGKWRLVDKEGRDLVATAIQEKSEQNTATTSHPDTSGAFEKTVTKFTRRPMRAGEARIHQQQEDLRRQAESYGASLAEFADVAASRPSGEKTKGGEDLIEKLIPGLKPGAVVEKTEYGTLKDYTKDLSAPKGLEKAVPRKGRPVSLLEQTVALLSGTRDAFASSVRDTEKQPLEGFAHEDGREYRPGNLKDANEDMRKRGKLEENRHIKDKGDEFRRIAEDLAEKARKAEKSAMKAGAKGKSYTDEQALALPLGADERVYEKPKFMDSIMEQGGNLDLAEQAAQFADDLVHATGSLTQSEYNADAKLLVDSLTARSGEIYINELRKILRAYPEIKKINPTAEQDLERLAAEKFGIGAVPDDPKGSTTYVFLSRSLGDAELRRIIKAAGETDRTDIVVAFRGVPEGMNINEGVLAMQSIYADLKKVPGIVIDPTLFTTYEVKQVPTVVRAKGRSVVEMVAAEQGKPDQPTVPQRIKKGEMVAKVEGLDNDRWLKEQIELGERGDLGIKGDVRDISEPDLIEVMKAKVAQVDWEAKKQAAFKNAWKNRKFIELETATQARVRTVDPTIVVQEDLKDIAGNAIRKKGDRVNPLEIRPFTMRLLVFNPTSAEELRRVDLYLSRLKMMGKGKPTLIGTKIDKERGWDSYTEITDRFDAHLFILTPDIEETFNLEVTPSVISADNTKHVFVVEELGPVEQKNKGSGEEQ